MLTIIASNYLRTKVFKWISGLSPSMDATYRWSVPHAASLTPFLFDYYFFWENNKTTWIIHSKKVRISLKISVIFKMATFKNRNGQWLANACYQCDLPSVGLNTPRQKQEKQFHCVHIYVLGFYWSIENKNKRYWGSNMGIHRVDNEASWLLSSTRDPVLVVLG